MRRAALALSITLAACHGSAPPAPSGGLTGIWLGTLTSHRSTLRLQLHLDFATSPPSCVVDSLDQGHAGIPCGHVVVSPTELAFDVDAVHGAFKGTISADANTVTGTWSQGADLPLVLTRQAAALEASKPPPALPPVTLDQLPAMLDEDLKPLLATQLAPGTGVGMTIGVVDHGVRKILSYGAVKPDSVFEIGSITKTFTGLLLAQLVEQKQVRLDEPVRALLPAGTVAAPASGPEITLLDLSAQRSGLPRLPDNLKPADPTNPYADYDAKALDAFLASHGVAMPAAPVFGYSNLGVGLLGQALADRAGTTYEALLGQEILAPLGMNDTAITLSPAQVARLASGHRANHAPQRGWDFGALAGAGAIRSTAADMLTYLEAQLHPDRLPPSARATPAGATLAAAIAASHVVRGDAMAGMHIALDWFQPGGTHVLWHNGATGGYSSYAELDPDADFAIVVLTNTSIEDGPLADDVGHHLAARLAGQPAMPLK